MATNAPAAISKEIASSTVSVRVPLWYCWVTSRARSMRSSLVLVTLVVGLACDRGVVSHSTSAHVAAAAAGRRTILIEGTSLSAGLGLDPDEAWPAVLQQRIDSEALPFVVVNAGLSGETSAGALRRIDWLLRGPVDVFVLETGANDGLRGLDPDSLRANMEAILAKVAAARPGAVLCVVQMEAPPNLGPRYAARFHAAFGEAARASGEWPAFRRSIRQTACTLRRPARGSLRRRNGGRWSPCSGPLTVRVSLCSLLGCPCWSTLSQLHTYSG
jgi:hypothetical protein